MRQLFYILFISLFFSPFLMSAQDEPLEFDEPADSIFLKCLYEHKHYISVNSLQFIVGTANINYEYSFTKRFSIKVGVGRILGYRILNNDHQIVSSGNNSISFGETYTGLNYFMFEPRVYTFKSTTNCWMQVGYALTYKFWDYEHKIPTDEIDPITEKTIYDYKNKQQHMVGFSVLGKHPVAGGFTFEYQLGFGAGPLNNSFYISPNLGFSMGWTL